MTGLRQIAEAVAILLALCLFRAIGLDAASALGGRLGRVLGPRARRRQEIARGNLRASFPELGDAEIGRILDEMWDNLGRFVGELPFLHRLCAEDDPRVEVAVAPEADAAIERGRPAIFVCAHCANWHLPARLESRWDQDLTILYRAIKNPWAERLFEKARARLGGHWVHRGRGGSRAVVKALASGGTVALMADQRIQGGLPVAFFGRPAPTATAIAHLALRYGAPLIPVRVRRRAGARFRIDLMAPLDRPSSGDREADARAILLDINRMLEGWIRERPGHWLWIHKRWQR